MSIESTAISVAQSLKNGELAKQVLAGALGVPPSYITCSLEVEADEIKTCWTLTTSLQSVEFATTGSSATELKPTASAT